MLADYGYGVPSLIYKVENDAYLSSNLLEKHETMNKRLNCFTILGSVFRHDMSLHSYCFHAVVNFAELTIEFSNPLFKGN